jgi:glycine oxidase
VEIYDVVVVGGGIIGGSTAFELARHGARVVLLDRQQPGLEASWAAAGMLAPTPETEDSIALLPLGRTSLSLYPSYVATVEEIAGQKVGLRQEATIHAFFGPEADRELSTLVGLSRGLGLAAEAVSVDEARRHEPSLNPELRAAAVLPEEGRVNNRALTEAVLCAAARQGAEIRAGREVTYVLLEGSRSVGVVASGEKIPASAVVVSAGCYSGRMETVERYAPTRPARGQMVALYPAREAGARAGDRAVRHVLRSTRGYLVPRETGQVIAGSTIEYAGFEKRVTPMGLQHILQAALELVPDLEKAAIVETWSGLRPDTPDHLPILGPTDIAGLFMATGHYRNGILLAPITAKLIREWILEGKASLPVEQFSPLRFQKQKAREAAP